VNTLDPSTFATVLLLGLAALSPVAFLLGSGRARRGERAGGRLHSRPRYYGWYAALWLALPALGLALLAALLHLLGLAKVPPAFLLAACLTAAGLGLHTALRTIRPDFRARNAVERVIRWCLVLASMISILATLGIVASILFEALHFFKFVSVWDFLTGTQWAPDTAFLQAAGREAEEVAQPKFGSLPIFAGTFMITAIAMAVAIPVGLLSAIYMSEYAPGPVRAAAKPMLEILAGIPTVVYGFFAAITVTPLVVQTAAFFGLNADYTNALSPGLVMGVMIIPFISSLSDDVISAVPQNLREGALALGTTRSETIRQVVLPAALPGIVASFILAVSRALGETMIVVMAAGLRPNLTWNPLEGMTTVTVRIVDALTGDQAFDSPETLSAFGLGLVLLVVTLFLNVLSALVIRRFRQKYE